MFKQYWNVLSVLTAAVFFAASMTIACADDDDTNPTGPSEEEHEEEEDDHGPGEEELITTLKLTLFPVAGGSPVMVQFQDLDGEGGNDPVQGTLVVNAGASYVGAVQVLNELETPPEDITEEVEEEAEAHQFFYQTLGGFSQATVTVSDKESDYGTNTGDDHPVGIEFQLMVPDNAQNGQLRVILSHYDEGPKDGMTMSDETDIDVTFQVEVRQ